MNYSMITFILGWIIRLEGIFMLFPMVVSLCYHENDAVWFLVCAICSILIGSILSRKRPKNNMFYAREGFVTVALSWIILGVIGALPFTLSGAIPSYIDALFEIVSGFTTTGASILTDVESLSHGMLFWRSFSHWIGGMGVLVFLLAILPLAGGGQGQTMYLMRSESPGPTFGKLVPKLQQSAIYLYGIYLVITVAQVIFLLIGKMPLFDALCTAFATAGTGGFGIRSDSLASYSTYIQIVTTVFMFLFGVNFNFYFLIIMRQIKGAFHLEEVRWYFAIFATAIAAITINLTIVSGNFLYNLQHAAFQVATVMTTTGFCTVDFNLWPSFSKTILVLLMFVGACAGSTGGGIKVSRWIIYIKSMGKELSTLIHPRNVKVLKSDGKAIDKNVVHSVNTYLICYMFVFIISLLLISLENFDMTTTFTAVVATINNIGPGLELVGPTGNYAMFSPLSKFVLMFDMLAGRLEIFPMLLLFSPGTWRRQ